MRKRWMGLALLGIGLAMLGGGIVSAHGPSGAFPGPAQHNAAGASQDDEATVPAGTLDDGADLLPLAGISIDEAIAAAQTAAAGEIGEVDLEYFDGALVFNVDVGDKDVKVDAATGEVIAVDADD